MNEKEKTIIEIKNLKEVNMNNMKAIFNVVLTTSDNITVIVYNLRLMQNKNGGYFVSMPSKKGSNNIWYNIVNLDKRTINIIYNMVIDMLDSIHETDGCGVHQEFERLPY